MNEERQQVWCLIKFYDIYTWDNVPKGLIEHIERWVKKKGIRRYGIEINHKDYLDLRTWENDEPESKC